MTTAEPTVVTDPDELVGVAATILQAVGVPAGDAQLVADSLVRADLCGHSSHGLLRLPWYVERIRAGSMTPVTEPEIVVDAGATAVLDGRDGVGQVLAAHAASQAVERARAHGVGAVGVRNSNHFGTAAYWTRRASDQGCVGVLATNASPAMAPWGGRDKAVGTNPWSVAAPAGRYGALVLDVANTAVARGKIYLARQEGRQIPADWALTENGERTTDPVAAIAGTLLPMAGHKGYAIAVVMDVLAGVLTGSSFGSSVVGPYDAGRRSGAGHLFIALDVSAFLPEQEFAARMEALIDELKAGGAPGQVLYPGELEARAEQRHRREGVPLAARTIDDLDRLARELGLDQLTTRTLSR